MRNVIHLLLSIFILTGCSSNKPILDSYESENLKVEKIRENLFRHISYLETANSGIVSCNGLVFLNNDKAIILDTPTNDIATVELVNLIGKENITAVIATHFHEDCLGGLGVFHSNKIDSYASNLTIELAKQNGKVLPKNGFEEKLEINVGNETVLLKHFGAGHTKDNIIGYIDSEKALFGGCLIKSLGAGKGNLNDANSKEWPITAAKVKKEFPSLEIVIPGHGKSGGIALLDYTIDLFTEK